MAECVSQNEPPEPRARDPASSCSHSQLPHVESAADMEKRAWNKSRGLKSLRIFANTLYEVVSTHREALFTCPACQNMLETPVTAECGHTFCAKCIASLPQGMCVQCHQPVPPVTAVNVLVHGILTRWQECNTLHQTPGESIFTYSKNLYIESSIRNM